jgi:hypothetical protein
MRMACEIYRPEKYSVELRGLSWLAKNEMNSVTKTLTPWNQDRSIDGHGSIPSAVSSGGSLPAV